MTNGSVSGALRSFTYSSSSSRHRYTRLFSVTIKHNYYTLEKGLCPDFSVVPTPTTATLMASLDLLLKDERTGFSVFYTSDSLPKIVSYLRREEQEAGSTPGFWSRLTFLLELGNPEFIGITALPIDTKSSKANLYGCNMQAHLEDGAALLPPGQYMDGHSLHPVVGSETTVNLPRTACRVTVADISGATVIPQPGAKPVRIYRAPNGAKSARLDFSSLPYDLYTVVVTLRGRRKTEVRYPRLYVPSGDSMALLDMLFTQPTRESDGGIYPIPPLFDGAPPPDPRRCGNVAYRLPFDARATYWRYYVVSDVPGGSLSDLSIRGAGARFEQDPTPVPLPDGSSAIKFTSDTMLPLRQKSPQRFQLRGLRRDPGGHENVIALSRLPVAPAAPVWPALHHPDTTGTSEMYVYV